MSFPPLSIASPSPPVLRLENLLEHILQNDLKTVMAKRDRCFNAVAQCVHLRQLLCDLQDLGMVRTVLADEAVVGNTYDSPASEEGNEGHSIPPSSGTGARLSMEVTVSASVPLPGELTYIGCEKGGDINNYSDGKSSGLPSCQALQATDMMVDIGQHFYMRAEIPNPAVVWINVGCGVICPMTHQEAKVVLKKKEGLFRNQSASLTKEILRVRFRMRLVKEAICRLQGFPCQ
eukprot:Tbor_TRINITY_DN6068_c2_g4::TRINITY_DN6068_c2_g4_i1::g.10714::m.10714